MRSAEKLPRARRKQPPMGRKPCELDTSTYAGRFAARLRELRDRRGKTVDELALSLGVAVSTVYGWENGTRRPDISQLPVIAEALGVKPRSLLPED